MFKVNISSLLQRKEACHGADLINLFNLLKPAQPYCQLVWTQVSLNFDESVQMLSPVLQLYIIENILKQF